MSFKRYFLYTSPAPVAQPPYFSSGWPHHVQAFHIGSISDPSARAWQHFLMVTHDEDFDMDQLPNGWTAIPHFLAGQPLPAAVLKILQQDFPNMTATDTTLTAMMKVAAKVHKHFGPVR